MILGNPSAPRTEGRNRWGASTGRHVAAGGNDFQRLSAYWLIGAPHIRARLGHVHFSAYLAALFFGFSTFQAAHILV
jgi:hypothetical protein